MSPTVLASLITAAVTVLTVLVGVFVWKPGQKVTTDTNVAQAQIDIATGALKLVTTGLTEEVDRLRVALAEARKEVEQLRAEVEICRIRHAHIDHPDTRE